MKFDARDFLSSSSFSRSSALAVSFARVNEKNVCVRNFSIEEREPQNSKRREGGCQRRDDASSFLSKSNLSSLSLSLFWKENENRKKSCAKPNARRSSRSYLSVCVCVFACCFLLSLCACVMCSVSQTSKKVRVCKNFYEDEERKRFFFFSTKTKN